MIDEWYDFIGESRIVGIRLLTDPLLQASFFF
jgi:hypothetical protein